MKAIGIFRGFPGLGRVVAGIEILKELQSINQLQIKAFSYLQGYELGKNNHIAIENILSINDVSSIGIIPVSKSGEKIIDEIEEFKPDFVLIDGEPLLVSAIKLRFPTLKVVVLLNPFDIDNPHNKLSSQLFFKDCYSKADISIVHGLWEVEKPTVFQNSFYSINTIVRKQVEEIKTDHESNRVACILGGGAVNSSQSFIDSTLYIADNTIFLANKNPNIFFEIFCGCKDLYEVICNKTRYTKNITVHQEIKSLQILYNSTKAIISRAGRNTISEILFLKIPSLLFATSCGIRGSEQEANIISAQKVSNNILRLDIDADKKMMERTFENLLSMSKSDVVWASGNDKLIQIMKKELLCI